MTKDRRAVFTKGFTPAFRGVARLGAATLITGLTLGPAMAQAPPPGLPAPDIQVAADPNSSAPIQPPGGLYMSAPLPANSPMPGADPRDFDGTWVHRTPLIFQIHVDMFGNKLPFTPAGQKVMDRRVKAMKDSTPFITASAKCFPMGQPFQLDIGTPFQILQTENYLQFIFEEYHGAYEVALDGWKPSGPAYMGSSVGRWDGATLVVETTGFKDGLWLDPNGTPASKDAKLTQRIRKVKAGDWRLEVTYTLDDPKYYSHPWSWVRDFIWRPDTALFREYNCELQTGRKGGVDQSLVPEPED